MLTNFGHLRPTAISTRFTTFHRGPFWAWRHRFLVRGDIDFKVVVVRKTGNVSIWECCFEWNILWTRQELPFANCKPMCSIPRSNPDHRKNWYWSYCRTVHYLRFLGKWFRWMLLGVGIPPKQKVESGALKCSINSRLPRSWWQSHWKKSRHARWGGTLGGGLSAAVLGMPAW